MTCCVLDPKNMAHVVCADRVGIGRYIILCSRNTCNLDKLNTGNPKLNLTR